MNLVAKFLGRLVIWTGLLLAAFTTLSVLSHAASVVTFVPVWAGRALGIAAFPAGLAVSREVLPEGAPQPRVLAVMAGLTVGLSAVTFVLANWIGPAVLRSQPPGEDVGWADAATMSYGELRSELRSAVAAAESEPTMSTIDHWLPANALRWQHDMRTLGSVLPFLLGWIGVFAGFWTRLTPRADLRQVQHWALGLFLVMSTYLAGENSYELIVLQAAGPVFFAGLFILFIPVMLLGGLSWPAGLVLWNRYRGSNSN